MPHDQVKSLPCDVDDDIRIIYDPILEKEDRREGKIIHTFAISVPAGVVCGFRRDEMNGVEAFAWQYRPDG